MWDHEATEESLSPWLQRLYDGLHVWVASPYGLAGPYKLSHSGAQGDSQGVGCFSKVSEKRSEYLRHAVREGLYPKNGRPGAPDPASYVPQQPAAPHGFLPEVAFSDDRRHLALSGWGLAWLMGICAVTCAAACGSVQVGKLKVYRLFLRHRRLHYASGTLPTTLGPLQLQSGGFMLTGIPVVMGEYPAPQVAKAEASLAKVGRALYRLRPAYVLVLRIVLAYVVSALNYIYDAMPPCPTRLRRTQRAVDRVLTRALRVPRNVPRALLWMPVPSGGFGFPHLYSRMRLRHVRGYLRAMDSRSVLVRENVQALSRPAAGRAWKVRTRNAPSKQWPRSAWRCASCLQPRRSPRPWTPRCARRTVPEGSSWWRMVQWRPRRTATPWAGARSWRTPAGCWRLRPPAS